MNHEIRERHENGNELWDSCYPEGGPFEVVKPIAVPVSQHQESLRLQPLRTSIVALPLLILKRAIQFDDQSSFEAGEVSDVVSDRNLSTESTTFELHDV